jgi:hypothetical protein
VGLYNLVMTLWRGEELEVQQLQRAEEAA